MTWEIDLPIPPPETATYDTDPRIAEVDATLAGVDLVLPGFKSMHPMAAQLPGSRIVVIEGAGHLPYEERPEEFSRIVREFLRHLRSTHTASPAR